MKASIWLAGSCFSPVCMAYSWSDHAQFCCLDAVFPDKVFLAEISRSL